MRQILRNGPLFASDIQVAECLEDGKPTGMVRILNRRTGSLASNEFFPTPENIEDVMKQCFEAGQTAKAAEVRAVLGVKGGE